jgi:hypothetical protein
MNVCFTAASDFSVQRKKLTKKNTPNPHPGSAKAVNMPILNQSIPPKNLKNL